jgi:hypothetical protein
MEPFWLVQWARSRSKQNVFGVPIRNFDKVIDTLFRGALPGDDGYRALVEKLAVRRVCSLIEHEVRDDRARALGAGIGEWRHMPFSDRDAPTSAQVRQWLEYVRTSERGDPVFTHCRGGRHRTGVLVAVYRVTDCGWTREQAFKEMLRFGWYSARGHRPLLDWFNRVFDPADYARGA